MTAMRVQQIAEVALVLAALVGVAASLAWFFPRKPRG